jgi:heme/copper-type cytochrome/quinol oxidase subunit 2
MAVAVSPITITAAAATAVAASAAIIINVTIIITVFVVVVVSVVIGRIVRHVWLRKRRQVHHGVAGRVRAAERNDNARRRRVVRHGNVAA